MLSGTSFLLGTREWMLSGFKTNPLIGFCKLVASTIVLILALIVSLASIGYGQLFSANPFLGFCKLVTTPIMLVLALIAGFASIGYGRLFPSQ